MFIIKKFALKVLRLVILTENIYHFGNTKFKFLLSTAFTNYLNLFVTIFNCLSQFLIEPLETFYSANLCNSRSTVFHLPLRLMFPINKKCNSDLFKPV